MNSSILRHHRHLLLLLVLLRTGLEASTLPLALDGPGIVSATSSSTPPWFGEDVPANAHDGADAARSGAIGHGEQAQFTAAVTGPGTLRFWWKVSSERTFDDAYWTLNGSPRPPISGESGWREETEVLTAGIHTLVWFYRKDGTVSAGADALWVDELRVVPPVTTTLEQALEITSPLVSVLTSGAPWQGWGAPYANRDGVDAARSGAGSSSSLGLQVTGPGIFTAWTRLNGSTGSSDPWMIITAAMRPLQGYGSLVQNWTQVRAEIPPGQQFVIFEWGTNSGDGTNPDRAGYVDQVAFQPAGTTTLAAALDATGLTWTTSGNGAWSGLLPPMPTHDGVDAARSSGTPNSGPSLLESTVIGPGVVTFWWRTDGSTSTRSTFSVDGSDKLLVIPQSQNVTNGEWYAESLEVTGGGAHTLRWAFSNPASGGCQWLDQVTWTAGGYTAVTLDSAVGSTGLFGVQPSPGWQGLQGPGLGRSGGNVARSVSGSPPETMRATITGPGELSWWWRSDNATRVNVFMDGALQHTEEFERAWEQMAMSIPPGTHTVDWLHDWNWAAFIDDVVFTPANPLGEAVDAPALVWRSTGPGGPWFHQTTETSDETDAARAPVTPHAGSSWIETDITGPGTLRFAWKVSSEAKPVWTPFGTGDQLSLWLSNQSSGLPQAIEGETGWTEHEVPITVSGPQKARWNYTKNAGGTAGQDTAWLDVVTFTPAGPTTLEEALDAAELTWTTGGSGVWAGQTGDPGAQKGSDFAKSPAGASAGVSWMQTTLTDGGNLSAWCRYTGGTGNLRVLLDGQLVSTVLPNSTTAFWWQVNVSAPSGAPHTVRFECDNNAGSWHVDDVIVITGNPVPSLSEALDAPAQTWTQGGTGGWTARTEAGMSHDGVDAARASTGSGALHVNLTGPSSAGFWWKRENAATSFVLRANGQAVVSTQAINSWEKSFTELILPGPQQLSWAIESLHNGSVSLDEVSVTLLSPVTLAAALDDGGITWQTSPAAPWTGWELPHTASDGADAAAGISPQTAVPSWLEGQWSGAGALSFRYRNGAPGAREGTFNISRDGGAAYVLNANSWARVLLPVASTGAHSARWTLTSLGPPAAPGAALLDDVTWHPSIVLGDALDAQSFIWTTSGTGWIGLPGAAAGAYSDDDAAASHVGPNEQAVLETTINGPGLLSCHVKTGPFNLSSLAFSVDGETQWSTTDAYGWQSFTHILAGGPHVIRWTHSRGAGNPETAVLAQVDAVTFTPAASPALEPALDLAGLTLRTGGTGGWMNQAAVTSDGEDALQSAFISTGSESWIEFDVSGPQFVTFYLLAQALPVTPSNTYTARVRITVDGTRQFEESVPPNGTWKRVTVRLQENTAHTIRISNLPSSQDTTPFSLFVDQLSVEPVQTTDLNTATGWAGAITTNAAFPWKGFSAAAAGLENGKMAAVGNLDFTGTTWLETTATGPGRFYFTQRLTPSNNYQALVFSRYLSVNGVLRGVGGDTMFVDLPAGTHTLRWEYRRGGSSTLRAPDWHIGEFSMFPGTSLADGLDTPGVTWTTDGSWGALLSGESAHDGVDFALADEATGFGGWLEAVLPGPGVLSFWLQQSGQGPTVLRATVNGWTTPWTVAETGPGGWVRGELTLNGPSQTIRFQIGNPAGAGTGQNSFRLDEVAVLPALAVALPEGLDAESLTWTTGPHGWSGYFNGGTDWAASSDVAPGDRSWLETTVPGPGLIRYRAGVFGSGPSTAGILSVWLPALAPEESVPGGIGVETEWRNNERVIVSGSGPQRVRWTYRDRDAMFGNTATIAALDAVSFSPAMPLAQALGTSSLTFSTSPDQQWIGVTDEIMWPAQPLHAVSGPAVNGRASWLETMVTGPASLRFHWLAQSPATLSGSLWMDDRLVSPLSGNNQFRLLVPTGQHTVRWESFASFSAGSRLAVVELLASPGDMLEWPEQPMLLQGEGIWSVSTTVTHDGVDSLVLPGPGALLTTRWHGPGTFFGWMREGSGSWTEFSHAQEWRGPGSITWTHAGPSVPLVILPRFLDEFHFVPAPPVGLGEAMDAPVLPWTTGGDAPWAGFGPPLRSNSGDDAAAAGILHPGETSWLETSVTGPGRLTFAASGALTWTVDGLPSPQTGGMPGAVSSFAVHTLLLASGPHIIRWSQTGTPGTDESYGAILDSVTFTADTAADDIAVAMDATGFPWAATGLPGWHTQTTVSHDGTDAVAAIDFGPQSLQTTVTGPGTVAFWWRRDYPVSTNISLTFQANTEPLVTAAWNTGWQRYERVLTAAGPQTLTWNLPTQGGGVITNGVDNSWLDQFSFVPAPAVSLAAAVDAPDFTWQTNPYAAWTGVTGALFSGDGVDAAAAGQPSPGEDSWLETEVTGPGTVSFLWRRTSGTAPLVCEIDGQFRGSAKNADFKPPSFSFETGGPHIIRWVLRRPLATDPVAAAAVDAFMFTPAAPESNYHAYAAAYLPEALRNPLADIDLDGLTNLVEFAHGLDPETDDSLTSDPGGLPALQLITGAAGNRFLEITFLRRRNTAGLTQTAQFAESPGGPWVNAGAVPRVSVLDEDWERLTVRDTAGGTRRFGRVLVTWQPPEY